MGTQDYYSCHGLGLMSKRKGKGKPPLSFTEELPTQLYFLFEDAKLT